MAAYSGCDPWILPYGLLQLKLHESLSLRLRKLAPLDTMDKYMYLCLPSLGGTTSYCNFITQDAFVNDRLHRARNYYRTVYPTDIMHALTTIL